MIRSSTLSAGSADSLVGLVAVDPDCPLAPGLTVPRCFTTSNTFPNPLNAGLAAHGFRDAKITSGAVSK